MSSFNYNRLNNISEYFNIIPRHAQNICDMDLNPYFTQEFTKEMYSTISKLKYKVINNVLKESKPGITIGKNDIFVTIRYDKSFNFEFITTSNYDSDESLPFHINIVKDFLISDFLEPSSLISKLNNIGISNNNSIYTMRQRYCSFEMDLCANDLTKNIDTKNSVSLHSVLLVFDTLKHEAYICDSNSNMSYFDNHINFYDHIPVSVFIHNMMDEYCKLLNYKYIRLLEDSNINLCINTKINSQSQQDFFEGYCRGWTLYFQYILNNAESTFEMLKYLKQISLTNKDVLNEVIELFQVYFWNITNIAYKISPDKLIDDFTESSNLTNEEIDKLIIDDILKNNNELTYEEIDKLIIDDISKNNDLIDDELNKIIMDSILLTNNIKDL